MRCFIFLLFVFSNALQASDEALLRDLSCALSEKGYALFDEKNPCITDKEKEDLKRLFASILDSGPKCAPDSEGSSDMLLMYFLNGKMQKFCHMFGPIQSIPSCVQTIAERLLHRIGYDQEACLVEAVLVDNFKRRSEYGESWSVSWHRDACSGSSHDVIMIVNLDLEGVPEHSFLLGCRTDGRIDVRARDKDIEALAILSVEPGHGYILNEFHEPHIYHATSRVQGCFGRASRKSLILRFASEQCGSLACMLRFYGGFTHLNWQYSF